MPPNSGHRNEFLLNRPSSHKSTASVGMCDIHEIGLENFIRQIAKVKDLNLGEDVVFNLNERGLLYKWDDVFTVERTYSRCLGISERYYTCHGYIFKTEQNHAYFVLEEYNKRSYSFLPGFNFFVLVCTHFDPDTRMITKVDVQYDQMSFFLHVFGIQNLWRWLIGNILTPVAMIWVMAFRATRCVNPFTFLLQVVLIPYAIYWYLL